MDQEQQKKALSIAIPVLIMVALGVGLGHILQAPAQEKIAEWKGNTTGSDDGEDRRQGTLGKNPFLLDGLKQLACQRALRAGEQPLPDECYDTYEELLHEFEQTRSLPSSARTEEAFFLDRATSPLYYDHCYAPGDITVAGRRFLGRKDWFSHTEEYERILQQIRPAAITLNHPYESGNHLYASFAPIIINDHDKDYASMAAETVYMDALLNRLNALYHDNCLFYEYYDTAAEAYGHYRFGYTKDETREAFAELYGHYLPCEKGGENSILVAAYIPGQDSILILTLKDKIRDVTIDGEEASYQEHLPFLFIDAPGLEPGFHTVSLDEDSVDFRVQRPTFTLSIDRYGGQDNPGITDDKLSLSVTNHESEAVTITEATPSRHCDPLSTVTLAPRNETTVEFSCSWPDTRNLPTTRDGSPIVELHIDLSLASKTRRDDPTLFVRAPIR